MAQISRAGGAVFGKYEKKSSFYAIVWNLEISLEDIIDGNKEVLDLT